MREFDLLKRIFAANAALPPRVTIPPGDDMGALRLTAPGGQEVLVTVDQLADGVHFDLATTPLEKIGRKAITRNLSDVAAMAAQPLGAVAAACLPRDFGEERANRLFEAMRLTAQAYDCPLIGGDVSMWDHRLIVTVTVLAEPAPGVIPVRRSGAQPGDVICVTGVLGGSLETLADGIGPIKPYIHHLDFEPRLALARELARRFGVHAMIDLSDGLGSDLAHICRASGAAAVIYEDMLSASGGAKQAAARDGKPLWHHILGDGEDYELCFCIAPEQALALPQEIDGVAICRIGAIVPPVDCPLVTLVLENGTHQEIAGLGWEHSGVGETGSTNSLAMTTDRSHTTWRETSPSAAQTMALGAAIARAARAGDLIALIGELGAGKTQWVRGMATALGVAPTALASPTFVMVQEYTGTPGKPVLVHIDAYRLRTPEDLESIGWDSAGASEMRRGAIVVIEWADRIAGAWGPEALKVHLTHVSEHEREVEITAIGPWAERLDALTPELDAILKLPATPTEPATSAAKCPICGKPLPAAAPAPFCSERCRLIDLGKWLGGKYSISRPIEPDPDEAE